MLILACILHRSPIILVRSVWVQGKVRLGARQSAFGCKAKCVWVQGKVCLGARQSVFGCKAKCVWVQGKVCLGARQSMFGCKAKYVWVQGKVRLGARQSALDSTCNQSPLHQVELTSISRRQSPIGTIPHHLTFSKA
jgi:hypothetical protein